MKKLSFAIVALALLSTSAMAANPVTTPNYFCSPMVGNWVNAAPTHCSMLGNGANSKQNVTIHVEPTPPPPPPPPKDCEEYTYKS